MSSQRRIIDHMNKDHNVSLQDYLAVYGNKKINSSISNLSLDSFELDHMVIAYSEESIKKSCRIPFKPPLNDFSESRLRLVSMAKEAAIKRGFSAFQIKDVVYPTQPLELFSLFAVCFVNLAPRFPSAVYFVLESLLNVSHETSTNVIAYSSILGLSLFAIHISEFFLVFRPLLKKYRVPTPVFQQYFFMCLFEGIFMIKRFKKMVNELENPTKEH